jgi:putative transposase
MDFLAPGAPVVWNDKDWVIRDLPSLEQVILEHPTTGQLQVAPASEIRSNVDLAKRRSGLMAISRDAWDDAHDKFQAIKPLLDLAPAQRSREKVEEAAESAGKSVATIYRWLNRWDKSRTVSSLVRSPRSDKGSRRIAEEVEKHVASQIDSYFMTKEQPTVVDLHEQIKIACRGAEPAAPSLPPPSLRTVHRRIDELSGRTVMARRQSPKLAREAYEPIKGSFPGAPVPLAVYQIDHSPIDVIFVDEQYRQPINRGYLTIVIDSCTRMLAGFYVTLDPPGALSTGLAMAQAILPKAPWLAERGIEAEWPIRGIPAKIFADNAKEFRGSMLERACAEYGIVMENRPKGLPNYGGHVERLFRTFMKRAHNIPGTTFSNVEERGEYDSDGRAIMTLKEFEAWFATFVTKVYHHRKHFGIGRVPPIKLYERFVLGSDTHIGIGLPAPVADEQKLRLDFMPFVERTVQEYGVVIDQIHYYADVLRPWVHARDPDARDRKRKFIFVRDPRDIGEIYFLDPETKTYFPIPYRDRTRPRMSVWELNATLNYLAQHPEMKPNEDMIFEGLAEMRQIIEQSASKSRKARRDQQRRTDWKKASGEKPGGAAVGAAPPSAPAPSAKAGQPRAPYEAFNDIEVSE